MSSIKDQFKAQLKPPSGAVLTETTWFAEVASDVSDLSDELKVIIPDFDLNYTWGPCFWYPPGPDTLPLQGDVCLVTFDNRMTPWVVAWDGASVGGGDGGTSTSDALTVIAGETFSDTVWGAPTGLSGTMGVTIKKPDGTVETARATSGIVEVAPGSYTYTGTAPSTAGYYVLVWDDTVDWVSIDLEVLP